MIRRQARIMGALATAGLGRGRPACAAGAPADSPPDAAGAGVRAGSGPSALASRASSRRTTPAAKRRTSAAARRARKPASASTRSRTRSTDSCRRAATPVRHAPPAGCSGTHAGAPPVSAQTHLSRTGQAGGLLHGGQGSCQGRGEPSGAARLVQHGLQVHALGVADALQEAHDAVVEEVGIARVPCAAPKTESGSACMRPARMRRPGAPPLAPPAAWARARARTAGRPAGGARPGGARCRSGRRWGRPAPAARGAPGRTRPP